MYDDPDKCNEGISNYKEIKEVLNYNNSENKLFPKYGERLYNEDLEEKIPNISDNNNKDTKKILSDENESDLSKLLSKDEKVDTKEKDNNHNDENIIIMGENEVKEDEYEIERKNPEKRKKIIKIYILLFFGAWGKLILTALLSKIEIIFEYANIIIAISGFIFIFILGALCNRNDDFSYSFLIILYNITYISFFTSLKILEKKDKYEIFSL